MPTPEVQEGAERFDSAVKEKVRAYSSGCRYAEKHKNRSEYCASASTREPD